MRYLIVFFLISVAYSQTPEPPFSLTISTPKAEVTAGDPVYVDVVMTNKSNHDIDCTVWFKNALDRNYLYDVTFEDGQPARDIDKDVHSSSAWPCVLEPGKSDTPSGGMLSTIYDFSRPGKYTVQVIRRIWGDENRPETVGTDYHQPDVKSNTIVITVLPKPEAIETK